LGFEESGGAASDGEPSDGFAFVDELASGFGLK
jgi:hypothetical protein